MSSDRIEIDADLLRAQARAAEGAADRIGTALQAVGSMNLGGGAFGLMCAFLVPIAATVTTVAASTMGEAAAMLGREAEALRATADDFDGHEQSLSGDLRQTGAELTAI